MLLKKGKMTKILLYFLAVVNTNRIMAGHTKNKKIANDLFRFNVSEITKLTITEIKKYITTKKVQKIMKDQEFDFHKQWKERVKELAEDYQTKLKKEKQKKGDYYS